MPPLEIVSLRVKNFRNLLEMPIEFGPKINCILGENGNGKTNILEAIHVLSTKKSFRKKTSFPQFLSVDGEEPEIIFSSLVRERGENVSYSAKLTPNSFELFQNGKPFKKRPKIPLVFINPFDASNFYSKASERRRWFDFHLGQLDKEYSASLRRYHTLLKFRNALLEDRQRYAREQLKAIDSEFVKVSQALTLSRECFLQEITPYYERIFKDIFSKNHNVSLHLETNISSGNSEKFKSLLVENSAKDFRARFTTYGPHKDDYLLLFDGLNSVEFCSLGQQKMSYLSLLFAYIELFRYKIGSFPIVLMDDVSGELDKSRWENLVQYLGRGKFQTLITTANEAFKDELEKIEGTKKIVVKSGLVKNV